MPRGAGFALAPGSAPAHMQPMTDAPPPSRRYPADFRPDAAYLADLPDLQNGPASLIVGARRPIQHVGIADFHLPIRYLTRDGGEVDLVTKGRHDPCVGIRAVPVGEAMMACVLADHYLRHRGQTGRGGPVGYPQE